MAEWNWRDQFNVDDDDEDDAGGDYQKVSRWMVVSQSVSQSVSVSVSQSVTLCRINMSMMSLSSAWEDFNPLSAKFSRENKNIYLHFMSFLHIDMTQLVEILPFERLGLAYFT